jgi:DNA end-binding protein Ku
VRKEDEYFAEIPDTKVTGEMLKLAEHIVETKTGDFEPDEFVDRYENAVVDLLKQKQAGKPISKTAADAPRRFEGNIVDLLRKSMELEDKRGKGKTKAPPLQPAMPKATKKGEGVLLKDQITALMEALPRWRSSDADGKAATTRWRQSRPSSTTRKFQVRCVALSRSSKDRGPCLDNPKQRHTWMTSCSDEHAYRH